MQKAALGCVRIRRGKCVPGSCVGVCATCVIQTMWLSICVSVWVGGIGEGECGKLEGAKWASVHVNELKVSAANYSPESLLVWQ